MAAHSSTWRRAGTLIIGVALAVAPLSSAGATEAEAAQAPLLGVGDADSIAGRYIVVLEDGASEQRVQQTVRIAAAAGGTVRFTYQHTIKGFSAALPAAALDAVRATAGVKYVAADGRVSASAVQPDPPSWGLDRVDQRNLPLDDRYAYVSSAGAGVDIYVIDTGIRFSHQDFGGRATSGIDLVDGGTADDCNGHGTHVAGTAGGSTYGVAKKASLVAVRVLDCAGSGSWENVIAGIDWVTGTHSGPSAANLSLGGGYQQAVNDATTASIQSGVVYAVSAGSSSSDACSFSPASTPLAITVGASTIDDDGASFSNYGTCLDLWAPGTSITSAWNTSDTASNTLSGTSMATPHATGVAALYLGLHPSASPKVVRNQMVGNASRNKLSSIGAGSPNRLLFSRVNRYS